MTYDPSLRRIENRKLAVAEACHEKNKGHMNGKSEDLTTEDEAALADFFGKIGDIYEATSRWLSHGGRLHG